MLTGVNNQIIQNSKHYYFNLVSILVLSGVAILLNYFLIPVYGINGAAIASAASLIIYNVVKYIFIFWKFKIQPFTLRTLYALLFGLLVYGIVMIVPYVGNPFIDILVKCLIIGTAYFLIT